MNTSLFKIDWWLVIPVMVLLFISLVTLSSINTTIFRSQLIFVGISVVIYFVCSQVNIRALANFSIPIYIVSLMSLFILLILGLESRGAIRWVTIFGVGVQFSEIFKPLLALCLASFLSNRQDTSSWTLFFVFALLFPVVFLIFKQPDLGSALIYLFVVILTLLFYGFSLKWFVGTIGVLAISLPFALRFLHGYQQQRLLTFFHLTNDPLGISYNAIQSVIAVGSGMFLGKGLGQGTQSGLRFLPERHTDFIFATLSEELGFVGGLLIIGAFCFLLYRLFILFTESDDMFTKVFILSTFSLFLIQVFVNIGMNIGILPIVGVTLPFVSYGGSSLISNAIFLGFVSSLTNIHRRKNVLEIM